MRYKNVLWETGARPDKGKSLREPNLISILLLLPFMIYRLIAEFRFDDFKLFHNFILIFKKTPNLMPLRLMKNLWRFLFSLMDMLSSKLPNIQLFDFQLIVKRNFWNKIFNDFLIYSIIRKFPSGTNDYLFLTNYFILRP